MTDETVVGWDGSAPAQRALEWALVRAEARSESVLIARVVLSETDASPGHPVLESTIEAAESALEQVRRSVQSLHPRLTIRSRLLYGEPVEELQSLSDVNTLLVVGTRSSRSPGDRVAWSVGARLAAVSYGPVAIIPDDSGALDTSRSGIVAGVDGSAASIVAVQYAAAEAINQGEKLTAVHAWQVPPMWADAPLDEESIHALGEVHQGILDTTIARVQLEFPTLTIERLVVEQSPLPVLREATAHSRLLVLGNHGLKSVQALVLGAVSHSLVRAVNVPTVVVREPVFAAIGPASLSRPAADHA
jgi:nucleotide-binding universal stress UspA family protein